MSKENAGGTEKRAEGVVLRGVNGPGRNHPARGKVPLGEGGKRGEACAVKVRCGV